MKYNEYKQRRMGEESGLIIPGQMNIFQFIEGSD